VRLAIRQTWDPADAPSRKVLASLQDTLGRPVVCEPDWAVLHAALSPFYTSDASQLVADAAGYIQCWARAAQDVLEDGDDGEALADKLLEALAQRGVHNLQLIVEVAPANAAQTAWDTDRACFLLLLPRGQAPHNPAAAVPAFRSHIMTAFDAKPMAKREVDAVDRDEWADVSVPVPVAPSAARTRTVPVAAQSEAAYLPDVNTLPRPDELLLTPPYHLHISQGAAITIECSHSPSLSFLEAYFRKWCRTNNRRTDRVSP
jgi:hypothetical protein